MSKYDKKVRKNMSTLADKKLKAVVDWTELYKHKYPKFFELSMDPIEALVSMMVEHDIDVYVAAELCEDFAKTWKGGPSDKEEES